MTTYRDYLNKLAADRPKPRPYLQYITIALILLAFVTSVILRSSDSEIMHDWSFAPIFPLLVWMKYYVANLKKRRVPCPRCSTDLRIYFAKTGKMISFSIGNATVGSIEKKAVSSAVGAGLPKTCPKCGLDFDSEMLPLNTSK